MAFLDYHPMPLYSTPYYQYSAVIEGSKYTFKFSWNDEAQFWSFSLFDSSGNPLVLGVKLVPKFDFLKNYKYKANIPNVIFDFRNVRDGNIIANQYDIEVDYRFGYIETTVKDEDPVV